ncbi:MAG: DnaJ domain-containing protein [Deltaproteobacteria bacterium]|nr:DnaJ domain-containing protein [Deltaproteobacteria bacterium]
MEIDAVDGLVALGLVTIDQATAAARIPDVALGRFGRLALVGVDVAALLPAVAALSGVKVAPPEVLSAPGHAGLAPDVQSALRALPACPLRRPENGPIDVVIADPASRARVAELLGPMFRPWIAAEPTVRLLAAQHLMAGAAPSPTVEAPKAAVAAAAPLHRADVASNQMAAFVEGPRAASSGLSPAVVAAAMAERVDLSDEDKRRILDLDGKIDRSSPAELLGVAPDATDDEVKERYYELSRAFHPDAHFRKQLGSFKPRVVRVFRALKKACDTLVAEVEERDHLDLGAGAADAAGAAAAAAAGAAGTTGTTGTTGAARAPVAPLAPAPAPAVTASSSQKLRGLISFDSIADRERPAPPTPAQPTPMPSAQPRARLRSGGELEIELDAGGAVPDVAVVPRRAEVAAIEPASLVVDPAVQAPPPRPRQVSAVRAPEGSKPRAGLDRRVIFGAAAGAALVIVVVLVVALRGGSGETPSLPTPAEKQAALLDQARAAATRGDFAVATAFASDALRLGTDGELAARAFAIRGTALVKNGDPAEGRADLQEAVKRLEPGDPLRGEAEAALAGITR